MNKLIRDKIPLIMNARGDTYTLRVIEDPEEYEEYLWKKLDEEILELREGRNIEEAADVVEVIRALVTTFGWSPSEIEPVREGKRLARGGFWDGKVLLTFDRH